MSEVKFKLAYNKEHRILYLDLAKDWFIEKIPPLVDIVEEANCIMKDHLDKGSFARYFVHEDLFKNVCTKMDTLKEEEYLNLSFPIASGILDIPAIKLETSQEEAFNLSFTKEIIKYKNLPFVVILNAINYLRIKLDIYDEGNSAQIHGAWLRALMGEAIQKLPISKVKRVENEKLHYQAIANRRRREISIIISDPEQFKSTKALAQIVKKGFDSTVKLKKITGDNYLFLKNETIDQLRRASRGPQLIGVGMPLMILVGIAKAPKDTKKVKAPQTQADHPAEKPPEKKRTRAPSKPQIPPKSQEETPPCEAEVPAIPSEYPGVGVLNMKVSDDGVLAMICDFDTAIYASELDFKPDANWLKYEAHRNGVCFGIKAEFINKIVASIEAKKDINDYILAQGKKAEPPREPYVYESYKEMEIAADEGKAVDLRDLQNRNIVKEGDLVAEIRYKHPKVLGKTVTGEVIDLDPQGDFDVTVGEGIEIREDGKFYSLIEGVPEISNHNINVLAHYIHEGDVDLKSGNIEFQGSLLVKGSIERGATVLVGGDIVVTGSIGSAYVRSGGTIKVKQGIVTTERGRVQARQDIIADFIGNSKVVCGGNIEVKNSITNSNIICGGNLKVVSKTGALAGGSVSCRYDIDVPRLGFPKGEVTVCNTGCDWNLELSYEINASRLKKIEELNKEHRILLRETTRKKGGGLKDDRKKVIEELQVKLAQEKDIMVRLRERVEDIRSQITWDKETKIFVHDLITSNVALCVGGVNVKVVHDLKEVVISAKKYRGANINSMEAYEKETEREAI